MDVLISDLQTLIKQPTSVSEKNKDLTNMHNLVVRIMKRAGISTEVLCLNDDSHSDDNNIMAIKKIILLLL